MKHPFNNIAATERLYNDFVSHGNLIVAFDFDNTIFDYHNTGGDYSELIDLLIDCTKVGFTLILYTVDTDQAEIDRRLDACKTMGIQVDYVNESPIFKGSKKPYFNILLDDRSGLESAYNQLTSVIDRIKSSM